MSKFKIGEKVIALTNPPNDRCQNRVKGHVYEVKAIKYCMGCGQQMINIGGVTSNPYVACILCGTNFQPNGNLQWTGQRHFAKVEDKSETLEEALANEDYELATILRDLNK